MMKRVDKFRQRAEHYRRLKWQHRDSATLQAMSDLAVEFEMTAEELQRQPHIRERAHEICFPERDLGSQ
jgi:hypothetical protein